MLSEKKEPVGRCTGRDLMSDAPLADGISRQFSDTISALCYYSNNLFTE